MESPTPEHIDEWKRCLLELPDELFFSIMRIYLGELKTPFHKPRLVDRVIHLFSKEETIQRATSLIDQQDALILTAIELLDCPSPQQIYRLLKDSYDYFNFHNHLMNLQERLLIFSCPGKPQLFVNPFIRSQINTSIFSPDLLFPPATPLHKNSGQPVWATEENAWCIIAYLVNYPEPLKSDGTLKKRVNEGFLTTFTSFSQDKAIEYLYLMINALQRLGILTRNGTSLRLVYKRGTEFGKKSRAERLYYLWAAACDSSYEYAENINTTSMNIEETAHTAATIKRLLHTIPRGYLFERKSIERMVIAAEPASEDAGGTDLLNPSRIVEHLMQIGALGFTPEGLFCNPAIEELLPENEEEQPLLVHPDFTVTVKPPLFFETGLFIAGVLELKSFAAYPQFELTRQSYLQGRRRFEFETIRDRLSELSATPLPQNILFSLDSWESHYSSVVMIEGITLSLASHWDHMVRSHPDFQTYVLRDFGNGIYVMDAAYRKKWQSLLHDIGIAPLPAVEGRGRGRRSHDIAHTEPPLPDITDKSSPTHSIADKFTDSQGTPISEEATEELLQELRGQLEQMHTKDSNHKKELAAQIEKKLFLFPSQLRQSKSSPILNEARGINYSGKVRIIQQALQSEWDLLELVERTSTGKPQRHLIRPKELQKSGNDLILTGKKLPGNEEFKVGVQKIGYIKKWKGSLFIQPQDYTQS